MKGEKTTMKITLNDKHITCAKDIINLKNNLTKTFQTNNITIEHNHQKKQYIIKLENITIPPKTNT